MTSNDIQAAKKKYNKTFQVPVVEPITDNVNLLADTILEEL